MADIEQGQSEREPKTGELQNADDYAGKSGDGSDLQHAATGVEEDAENLLPADAHPGSEKSDDERRRGRQAARLLPAGDLE